MELDLGEENGQNRQNLFCPLPLAIATSKLIGEKDETVNLPNKNRREHECSEKFEEGSMRVAYPWKKDSADKKSIMKLIHEV